MGQQAAHGLVLPSAFDHLDEASARRLADADDFVVGAWAAAVDAVGLQDAAEYLRDRVLELQLDDGGRPRRARAAIGLRLRTRVLERARWRCERCGSTQELVVDHVLPVARGGSSGEWNLAALCAPCNASKGDRLG